MNPQFQNLVDYHKGLDRAMLAFSGGVDSTLLLHGAFHALGSNLIAVVAVSPTLPGSELALAQGVVSELGVRLVELESVEMTDNNFLANRDDRCYCCKRIRFTAMRELADRQGILHILEGSNDDDLDDYRPGLRAVSELKIRSPYLELGWGKATIRKLAKEIGQESWDRPASACLATRIPSGQQITVLRLQRIESAEEVLREFGFRQLRARDHGELVRVEVEADEIPRLLDSEIRHQVATRLKEIGYKFVSFDLEGYRTGAMNPVNS